METEVIQGTTAEWCDFAVLHWCSTRKINPQISAVGNEEFKSKSHYTNAMKRPQDIFKGVDNGVCPF